MEKQAASILKLYRGNVRHAANITYDETESGRRYAESYQFYCSQERHQMATPHIIFIPPSTENVTCRKCLKILAEREKGIS